jgi:hypothetical protein
MRYVISFGQAIHVNGMVITRHNSKVMVQWVNLPDKPCVLLNPGDSAFNYLDAKMITVGKWYPNNDIPIEVTGCDTKDVVTCTVLSDSVHTKEYNASYSHDSDETCSLQECKPTLKLAIALREVCMIRYWY